MRKSDWDGGAAFSEIGMSLRDWFAGMAMQSIQRELSFYEQKQCEEAVNKGETSWREIRQSTDVEITTEDKETLAFSAYCIADAMLKARKETK